MMYSINLTFCSIILILSFASCGKPGKIEPCEFEVIGGSHYLNVPIEFIPHREVYHIGDTVTVDMTFQDSIYCQGTRQTFKIEEFIFNPISGMYRMWPEGDSFGWDSGFRVNELLIDTVRYNFEYKYYGSIADQFISSIIYDSETDTYEYSYQIVFNAPGRYIFFTTDYSLGTWNTDPDYNDMINTIDWEGKCQLEVTVACTLEHDGHYSDYINELQYLNTEVRPGNIHSLNPDLGLGSAVSFALENNAGFCFEVVE